MKTACLALLLLSLAFVPPASAAETPAKPAAEPPEIISLRVKAERGNAIAEYNLGLAYAQGRVVPVDLAEAYVWLSLAAETGSTGKALEALLGTINNSQLAEGRRRLETLRATNPYLKPLPVNRSVAPGPGSAGPASPASPVTPVGSAVKSAAAETPRGAAAADPGTQSDEARRLYEQLSTVTTEKKQVSDALAEARRETARLQSELATLRAKAGPVDPDRVKNTASDPAEKLSAELEGVRRELAAAQSKAAAAESSANSDARAALAKSDAALAAQTRELAAARADAEKNRTALAAAQAKFTAAETQRDEITRQAATTTAAAAKSEAQLATLRTDLKKLETERDALTARLAQSASALSAKAAAATAEARTTADTGAQAAALSTEPARSAPKICRR